MSCPNCHDCQLYHTLNHNDERDDIIADYCMDDENHKVCARFVKLADGDKVPPTLLPDGSDLRKR